MNSHYYKIQIYFFCLIYFCWVFFIHINGSQYFTLFDSDSLIKTFNLGVILLLSLYFIFSYRINNSTLIDIFLAVIFFVGYMHFEKGVLIFVFIVMCRQIPFSIIVKTFLFATFIGMLFVLITYLFDLYPESYLDLYREDGSYRFLLGYRFPTFLPNYYFHIVLCWFFLRKEKINIIEIIVILLINVLIYQLTNTRAVYYLVILICFAVGFVKYFRVEFSTFFVGRFFKLLTKYSFIIWGALAVYLHYNYNQSVDWMGRLNSIFSGRLALGHWGFELYDIRLFGNFIEFTTMLDASDSNKFFYIDSAYVQLLLVYGVAIFALVMVGYTKIGHEIVRKNDKYFGIVLIFLLIHSLTDPQLMSPEFNPFLLCLGYYGLSQYKENLFK